MLRTREARGIQAGGFGSSWPHRIQAGVIKRPVGTGLPDVQRALSLQQHLSGPKGSCRGGHLWERNAGRWSKLGGMRSLVSEVGRQQSVRKVMYRAMGPITSAIPDPTVYHPRPYRLPSQTLPDPTVRHPRSYRPPTCSLARVRGAIALYAATLAGRYCKPLSAATATPPATA